MSKLHSYKVDFDKMILKSPFNEKEKKAMSVQQMREKIVVSESACTRDTRWWGDEIIFMNVLCKEHDGYELVPERNYRNDLARWYKIGLHPRFSIDHALISVGQRWGEIFRVINGTRWANDDDKGNLHRKLFETALRNSKTEKELLENLHPLLFTNIYLDGRRYRVTNAFKEKFKAKNFTVADFFQNESQELRRLILRRGVSVKDVMGKMKILAEDSEGKICELKGRNDWRNQHYLYVVCPSTGQEYLLGIPQRFTSPKAARRWTFDVPEDAHFVKEA